MKTRIVVFFCCVLLGMQCLCYVHGSIREGTCTNCSQIVFLEPPADFVPRFEVSGCFIEHDSKVLFLLRNENKPQGSSWCVPGGKLQNNETASEALIREVQEEIGINLDTKALIYCRPVYVRFPTTEFVLHLFRFSFDTTPPPLSLALEEHVDSRWVSYEEIADLSLIPGGKECFCIVFKDKLSSRFLRETR